MKINRYTETIIRARATPNLVDQGAIISAGSTAGAIADIAGAGYEYAKKLEDSETRTWLNKAIIETQKEAYIRADKVKSNPNAAYKGFSDTFKTDISKYYQDYAKTAPNEEARQAYIDAMNEYDLQIYKDNKSWENRRAVEVGAENIKFASEDLKELAYRNKVQGKSNEDLFKQADATTMAAIDIYSTDQLARLNKEIYQGIEQSELDAMLDTNPEELIRETTVGRYSPGDIDADKAINEIMRLEGGYVADDAGKGPTLYGINSEANPEEYKDIKALYDAGKSAKAQEKARETYKKKYWDAIDADSLPPELRLVAFDAAVNQGQGAAKEMIRQADGDAGKFAQIRKSRYIQLASADPSKAQFLDAWLSRTDETARIAKGSDLPPSLLMEYRKKGQAYLGTKIREEATKIETAAKMGLVMDESVIRGLESKARGAAMPEVADSLARYADTQIEARDFAVQSTADQRARLKELGDEIEGGNLSKVDEYEAVSGVYKTKFEMVEKGEAWEYYSAHDVIKEPEPIDFNNPESVSLGIDQRRKDMDLIYNLEGTAIPVLTGAEIKGLKQMYQDGTADVVASTISTLSASLRPGERRSLAQQFDKADAPMIAAAMGQPVDVSEGILAGAKLEDVVSPKVVKETINSKLEGYVYDAEAYTGATQAINAYYKHLSILEGDMTSDLDRDRMDRAIEEVLGKPEEISVFGNPSKILLYRDEQGNFVKPSHVEDVLERMSSRAIEKSGGAYPVTSNGDWIDVEEIKKKATFITTGDGKFIAEYTGLGMIMSNKGGPFEFDIRAIESNLTDEKRRRRLPRTYFLD